MIAASLTISDIRLPTARGHQCQWSVCVRYFDVLVTSSHTILLQCSCSWSWTTLVDLQICHRTERNVDKVTEKVWDKVLLNVVFDSLRRPAMLCITDSWYYRSNWWLDYAVSCVVCSPPLCPVLPHNGRALIRLQLTVSRRCPHRGSSNARYMIWCDIP